VSHWSIVLAGGEGTRMRQVIRRLFGFPYPKQYCTFCGTRSMLEHTLARARKLVEPSRIVTIIGNGHRRFLREGCISDGVLLEQPRSRGTAAGILVPAAFIHARDPDALVYILPSDHFVHPEPRFVAQMRRIGKLARSLSKYIVLVGVPAATPESEYGWIEPGEPLEGWRWSERQVPRRVTGFREKPNRRLAREWLSSGYLWNTLIMVCQVSTLMSLGHRFLPGMMARLNAFVEDIQTKGRSPLASSRGQLEVLYDGLPSANFSRTMLERAGPASLCFPLVDVEWSDWGSPERVIRTLEKMGVESPLLGPASGLSDLEVSSA
jgi:mannose-1-phosphate guanylyltransferase